MWINTYSSEWLKIRRTSAIWLTVLGAAFIPVVTLLIYASKPEIFAKDLQADPWGQHLERCWNSIAAFLFPMYVILLNSLVIQVETRNQTWKQWLVTPQPFFRMFSAKFAVILSLLVVCFLLFNGFLLVTGVVTDWIRPQYTFLEKPIDVKYWIRFNAWMFYTSMPILVLQYALSLRFRNFIVPIGVGLAAVILTIVLIQWDKVHHLPYAHPLIAILRAVNPAKTAVAWKGLSLHQSVLVWTLLGGVVSWVIFRYRRERA